MLRSSPDPATLLSLDLPQSPVLRSLWIRCPYAELNPQIPPRRKTQQNPRVELTNDVIACGCEFVRSIAGGRGTTPCFSRYLASCAGLTGLVIAKASQVLLSSLRRFLTPGKSPSSRTRNIMSAARVVSILRIDCCRQLVPAAGASEAAWSFRVFCYLEPISNHAKWTCYCRATKKSLQT